MHIRGAFPTEKDTLLTIWERSVRATHDFLSESDIAYLRPLVRDALQNHVFEVWLLASDDERILGWMGLDGNKIEALFVDPDHFGQGGGSRLVDYASVLNGELTVDVNEQNAGARAFYEAIGFVVEGRSELDGQGRPFPLLHMRRDG